MEQKRIVFSQVMDFLPDYEFRRAVSRYEGEYKVRNFSCRDQFFCMAFAQLIQRESLRDIETCLRAAGRRLYHMGIRGHVARNNLARANERRSWHIYADLAQVLINIARPLYAEDDPMVPPRTGDRLAELIPDADYSTLSASSHFVQVDSPRQFVEHVRTFLETTPGDD